MAIFVAPLPARRALCAPSALRCATTCKAAGPRPSRDDVERLSRGQAAKRRGTGSRAVPHRLNAPLRREYDAAMRKGLVTVDAAGRIPLVNIWRMWSDARALPAVMLLRRASGEAPDVVRVDMSTVRAPDDDDEALAKRFDAAVQAEGVRLVEESWPAGDARAAAFTPTWAIGARTVEYAFDERGDAKTRPPAAPSCPGRRRARRKQDVRWNADEMVDTWMRSTRPSKHHLDLKTWLTSKIPPLPRNSTTDNTEVEELLESGKTKHLKTSLPCEFLVLHGGGGRAVAIRLTAYHSGDENDEAVVHAAQPRPGVPPVIFRTSNCLPLDPFFFDGLLLVTLLARSLLCLSPRCTSGALSEALRMAPGFC